MQIKVAIRCLVSAIALSGSMVAIASPLTVTDLAFKKTKERSVSPGFSESHEKIARGRSQAISWCTEPLDHKFIGAMQRYLDPKTSLVRASVQVLVATKSLIWQSAASKAEQTQQLNGNLEAGFEKLAEISEVLSREGLIESGYVDSVPSELITTLLLNQSDYDVCDHFHRVIRSKAQTMLSKLKESKTLNLDPKAKEGYIRFLEVLVRPTVVRHPLDETPIYDVGGTSGAK